MKQGWQIETISSLCEQMNGIWKGEKEPLTTAKILRTTNFSKDCQMKLDDLAIIEVEQKKMEKRRLKRGDIIVEKSGGGPKQPVGRVILFNIDDDDFSFCNFTSALRIKDQTKILPEFLHKYLTYLYFSGETEKYQSNLVGFRNLDFKGYVSICVKYPPLSEQQRIVSLLDAEFAKIDALKANAEKNLQNAKDLFQAALKKELEPKEGWKEKTLYEISVRMADGPFGSNLKKEHYTNNKEVRIIQLSNIGEEGWREDNTKYTTFEHLKTISRSEVFPDDVVIAKMMPAGRAILCPNHEKKYVLSSDAVKVEIKDGLNKRFILYFINSPYFRSQVYENVTGSGRVRTSLTKLKDCKLRIPPLSYQQSIVARLDALNGKCKSLQANYEKTLRLCDDLKQALLRKAFNGEI